MISACGIYTTSTDHAFLIAIGKPSSDGSLTQDGINRAFSGKQRQSSLIYNCKRWSRIPGQFGGLAKVDSGFDYAANFSSFACVA